ncbi:hypothetical protein JOF56_002211 [Kibdelosporangium banguiense]|uniref:Uncharacterized protein n=1 Tax=Kibdelosporangium banguiense TaxID=1365924 RepID=A0ABS4TBM8_9PSEU|nr:hypothetical protein [Kibdelosporangium banguiense]
MDGLSVTRVGECLCEGVKAPGSRLGVGRLPWGL